MEGGSTATSQAQESPEAGHLAAFGHSGWENTGSSPTTTGSGEVKQPDKQESTKSISLPANKASRHWRLVVSLLGVDLRPLLAQALDQGVKAVTLVALPPWVGP